MNEPLPWLYTCKSSSVRNVISSVRWMDLAGAFERFKVKCLAVLKGFSMFKKRSVCLSVSSDI